MGARIIPQPLTCQKCNSKPNIQRRGKYEQMVEVDEHGELTAASKMMVFTSSFFVTCPKCKTIERADSARAAVTHWNKKYGKED